jgi:hypothetical protein
MNLKNRGGSRWRLAIPARKGGRKVFDAHIRFVVDQMRAAYPHLKDADIANLLALYIDMRDAGFGSAAIAVALEGEISSG